MPFQKSIASWCAAPAAVLALCAGAPAAAPAAPPASAPAVATADALHEIPGERLYSGRIVVRPLQPDALARLGLDDKAAAQARADAAEVLAPWVITHRARTDEYFLAVPPGVRDDDFCRALFALGHFQYAEPDWTVFTLASPNDTQFGQQWHHAKMESPLAWDTVTGSPSVIVAVVDTGAQTDHPDLVDTLVAGAHFVGSATPQSSGGNVSPANGGAHGTLCGGAAAARGNNGLGVSGMGWTLSLMPVRCTNQATTGALSDITGGALWAAENGAKVVSCSWSGVGSSTVQTTGESVRALGATLLYAASNASTHMPTFDHTAVIVVAASDQSDNRASFSNFGRPIDVAAPGVSIHTTTTGSGFSAASGTSLSTPLAAGALAMIHSANPALTNDQAVAILRASSDDLGAPGRDRVYGFGRVNLRRAVQMAQAATAAPILAADSFVSNAGQTLTLDVLYNDPSGDQGLALSLITSSPLPSGATITLHSGGGAGVGGGRDTIRYIPAPGFVGIDTFTYQASLGAESAQALVTVDVRATPLVAQNDTFAAQEAVAIDLDMLANDGPFDNGQPWTITVPPQTPAGAFVSFTRAAGPSGRDHIRYTVNGFTGTDTFTYTFTDMAGQTASATVTVNVGPSLPNPVLDEAVTPQGLPVSIDVLANDTHPANRTITIQSFDTATANGGVITRLIGAGPNGRDVLRYQPAAAFIGADTFTYTAVDSANRTAVGTVNVLVEDLALYRDADNPPFTRPGVSADYYTLTNPSVLPDFSALSPVSNIVYPAINFPSTNGVFANSTFSDDFGAVFTGFITVPAHARYTFYSTSDDGSRLWIGDEPVLDNNGLHGMQERSGAIRLKAGRHAFRVEFFEHLVGAGLEVRYEGPALAKQLVPAAAFSIPRHPADLCNALGVTPADGFITGADFDYFIQAFFTDHPDADLAHSGTMAPGPDGFITGDDFDFFILAFFSGL